MFEKLKSYVLYIFVILVIIGFFLPGIIEIIPTSWFPKKSKIDFYKFIENSNIQVSQDSALFKLRVEGNEILIVLESKKYNINILCEAIDSMDVDERILKNMAAVLIPFLNVTTEDCKVDNYIFLNSFTNKFKSFLPSNSYIDFMNGFIDYCTNNDLFFLVEPLEINKSWYYYNIGDYTEVYELNHQYSQFWLNYEFYQIHYLNTLWQIGHFSELQALLKNDVILKDLKEEYNKKIDNLIQANSTYQSPDLSGAKKISIFILLIILFLILAFRISEIFSYFKIFYFYKYPDLKKREQLYQKLYASKETDLACPICGIGINHADKISGQHGHKDFYVCPSHQEILVPVHTCAICGIALDEYNNCKVCGFNQKGELTWIFVFDLLTSLLYCIFLTITILAVSYHFFADQFPFDFRFLKIYCQSTYLLCLIIALLPFILKDLNIKSLSKFYKFERYYFVSLDKFSALVIISYLLILLVPNNAMYNTKFFISFIDFFTIFVLGYGIYKFLSYGQEHKSYYENFITTEFKGSLVVIVITFSINIFRNLPNLFNNWSGLLSDINKISTINRIVFCLFILIILINSRKISKKADTFDMISMFVQDNVRSFVYFFSFILFITIFLMIKWFLTRHYINIHVIFIELLLLGSYYFIIARQENRILNFQQKRHRSFLAFEHNLYIFLYTLFILFINLTSFVNTINFNTDIISLNGLVKAFILISKNQLIALSDFHDKANSIFYWAGAIGICVMFVFFILIYRKFKKLYGFVHPKLYVNINEAERVKLLFKHLEFFAKYINKLCNRIEPDIRENIEIRLLEHKYLMDTYDTNDIEFKNHGVVPMESIMNSDKTEVIQIRFNNYSKKIFDYKKNINNPSIFDKDVNLEDIGLAPIKDFKLIIIWETKLKKEILLKNNKYLQLSEKIWSKSLQLFYWSLQRIYDQLTSDYYMQISYTKPYSISLYNYFTIVYSEYAYLPASVEKIVAMKWNNKHTDDFVYIYFCDNYPQIKTASYLELYEDRNILLGKKIEETASYRNAVSSLLDEFDAFKSEVRSYGYKCEFFPINATIQVEDCVRTPFDDNEKINANDRMVKIKNKTEYYQAKFVIIVERLSFEQIQDLDEIENPYFFIDD
ncbi:MAG TPA: hypothetical protein VK179_21265 [Bacteroidales bacterium]|nr:hypothetical protein [Bacteroidales bacterium]